MAYLDTKRRPSAASLAAVIAVHGAVGAALILGLTVSGVIMTEPRIATFDRPATPPPPPPPKPDEAKPETARLDPFVPRPPFPLPTQGPVISTTDAFPPPLPPLPQPGPSEGLKPNLPAATPGFTAVAARPRNDPARWVSEADYRGDWIRRELTGKARFRLDIAADGRVTGCTIIASSGHPALDQATCTLVSRRARFQPALGEQGAPVAGSYTNAIDWRLPE